MRRTTDHPLSPLLALLLTLPLIALSPGCDDGGGSGDDTGETGGDGDGDGRPDELLVTADFEAQRLSLVDAEALREPGATRDDALWAEVDLSGYPGAGPIQVELTPDASQAVVAIGPGFFQGIVGNTIGATDVPDGGALLLVDLDSQTVTAEFDTMHVPMGIAISHDGSTAFAANFGDSSSSGNTMAVLDLDAGTVTADFEVGPGPEQIDLSPDGSLGVINTAGDGGVRLFSTSDPEGTIGNTVSTSSDSSWIVFVESNPSRAVVANSVLGNSSASLLDVSDPQNPAVLDELPLPAIPYAAMSLPGSDEVLMTGVEGGATIVYRLATSGDGLSIAEEVAIAEAGLSFPLGISVDAAGTFAYMGAPGDNRVVILDLATFEATAVDWQGSIGPTSAVISR